MKARIFLTGVAMMALTSVAFAQTPVRGNGNCTGTCTGINFVDSNNDGVCDNYGTNKSAAQRGKRDGSGNGQGKGNKKGSGTGTCRRS